MPPLWTASIWRWPRRPARPAFYRDAMGVPDTVEGRFDMLTLHAVAGAAASSRPVGPGRRSRAGPGRRGLRPVRPRALRELGVGDISVPKRMKDMAGAFYGRVGLRGGFGRREPLDGAALRERVCPGARGSSREPAGAGRATSRAAGLALDGARRRHGGCEGDPALSGARTFCREAPHETSISPEDPSAARRAFRGADVDGPPASGLDVVVEADAAERAAVAADFELPGIAALASAASMSAIPASACA